ncbi:hypothetical protein RND81_10G122200 [Saponaria officinalis]|uniref:Uncharacterized protein n=1 Tax=Saponaria officinalis TaxID=3572 RepID=A0AAW1I1H0_SAPOF
MMFMERGPRYEVYAQLRESNLQSKRFKLEEDDQVSEIPISDFSPEVKKLDEFHGKLGDFREDDRVSGIPKPGFLRKSMNFHGMLNDFEEKVEFCEIPKSEYSPILKKSAKFHQNLYNFGENGQISSIPRPNFVRKSVKFHGISENVEENVQISPTMKKFNMKTGRKQGYSVLAQSVPDLTSVLRKENRKPTPEYGNVSLIPTLGKSETPPLSISKGGKMYGKSVNSGEKQSNVKMNMSRKSYASVEELKGLSIVANNAINGKNRRGRKSAVFSSKYY